MGESGGPAHSQAKNVDCRLNCGACCIAPSITSLGKPAGVACDHLDADLRCAIFGQSGRPACCAGLQPSAEMCGASREEALRWLADLEARTAPDRRSGAQLVQPLPKVVGARREA
jgi:hypothetical protein